MKTKREENSHQRVYFLDVSEAFSFWLSVSCNSRPLLCLTVKLHSHYFHSKPEIPMTVTGFLRIDTNTTAAKTALAFPSTCQPKTCHSFILFPMWGHSHKFQQTYETALKC